MHVVPLVPADTTIPYINLINMAPNLLAYAQAIAFTTPISCF